MNYYELDFSYLSPTDTDIISDILGNELGEIGFESFIPHEKGLIAYIPEKLFDATALKEKLMEFPLEDTQISFSEKFIVGKDWNEEWEKNYFKPIRIDNKCIIRASFHEKEPGFEYEIIIDPKMAFGTGNHETTFLMIGEILKAGISGKEILDMGCGTAVLAILAHKKNAARVIAIDIDDWAYNNALENIRLNNADDIQVVLGGAERIREFSPFDIIFANINRNILLQDIQVYALNLKPGGQLYMSGFYKEDIPAIEKACAASSLSIASITEKNNWVAVKAL